MQHEQHHGQARSGPAVSWFGRLKTGGRGGGVDRGHMGIIAAVRAASTARRSRGRPDRSRRRPVTFTRTMSPGCSPLPLTRTRQSMSGASAWLRARTWLGTSGSGAVDDHLHLAADLPPAPVEGDLLLACHQPVAALLLDLLGQVAVQLVGRRARLERIREDADALELRFADEVAQLLELGLGLAGEADDERRSQRQVRDARCAACRAVPRSSARLTRRCIRLQHPVVDVLQRHVEVRHDLLRPSRAFRSARR